MTRGALSLPSELEAGVQPTLRSVLLDCSRQRVNTKIVYPTKSVVVKSKELESALGPESAFQDK